MQNHKPVSLPSRTVITNTSSGKYAYLTQSVIYNKDLKCSRPKRIAIGKVNEDGKLIPNQNYYDLYIKEIEKNILSLRF